MTNDKLLISEKEFILERPFDFLQYKKNREIILIKSDDKEVKGILLSYDMNLNLVLENEIGDLIFIKGNFVKEIV